MKERTFNLVHDALSGVLQGLRQEREAAQKEVSELKWGIDVCERHLDRAYEQQAVAGAVGDTMRVWLGMQL